MLDLKMKIVIGITSGLLVAAFILLILLFILVCAVVKKVKSANCGDVENCVESGKSTQEKIIQAKPIMDESCIREYCEECSIYADSGTLPPCFCGLDEGL